mmetsp:Transcript_17048/g.36761  ORF Transcript_17048/g.36761 Transcript_17048/m.36761 type:complete len:352 (+) Transcript_17048:208-1263(+)|eukprot:CAMPEP_0172297454 /NCGR_PEP_ID=MMETSP1058-20130122/469_1 /TAXON_ID=83371 /ORGANISM="Detonula confervacea, Strain CCMP 353" /LENGTH=351 /DNA_ID=CAMNT_0013006611 /DNA_START=154 /DNA_END=1209 /DNA_ORIENTATION=+
MRGIYFLNNAIGGIVIASAATATAFTTSFPIAITTRQTKAPISLDTHPVPFLSITRAEKTQLQLNPIHHESISAFVSSSLISTDASSYFNLFQFSGNVPFVSSLVLNTILFFSLRPKLMTMLTPEGFAHSLALGTMLWTTLGWRGWTVCVLYLFLGQLVTKVGFAEKDALGIAEGRGGRRGPENVWGSAFTGVMCAAAAAQALKSGVPFLGLASDVWILGYVASLATKLADTFASEIGKAYGKTTFLITTLKPAERGAEGAISLEGTLASIVGGFLLSVYAYLVVGLIPSVAGVGIATFAAFAGTMIESLIGATLQEKEGFEWMTNEVVNFFNTLIGAAIAMSLGVLVLGM